jgi:SAM-dependent methyltransferase
MIQLKQTEDYYSGNGSPLWQLARRMARMAAFVKPEANHVLYKGCVLPPKRLRTKMCGESYTSNEFFLASGIVEAQRLAVDLGYTPSSTLVDIGSGLGRLATGMLWEFGDDVNYLGLEANKTFFEWCRKNIESQHSSFRFKYVDVVNEVYNPNGKFDGDRIRLPVDNEQADIVYLWGVFTNMGLEHVRIYVSEISRIVRNGGRIFLTAFVEDNVPEVSVNPTDYNPFFDYRVPLQVVRYDRSQLFALFHSHGLTVQRFRYHGGSYPCQSEIYLTKQ